MSQTMKAKALTLRPHEARRLDKDGRATIVREVTPQPHPSCSEDGEGWHWHSRGRDDHYLFATDERHLAESMVRDDACPFGPVGLELWGRETWAEWLLCGGRAKGWGGREHGWGNTIYRATFGAAMDPECEGFTAWRSSTSMPIAASRFPRLRLAECEVKRAGATLDIPAGRWCWFATIEDAKREGAAK